MPKRIRVWLSERPDDTTVLRIKNGHNWLDIPADEARALLDEAHDRLDTFEARNRMENPT